MARAYARWCSANEVSLIEVACEWLESHRPKSRPDGFSWGDARLQNVIVKDDRCAAILDWDMATLAGAEADLAWWALADHKRTLTQGVPRLSGIGSPAQTIALWETLSGRPVRDMDWYLVFAAYRQALISFRMFRVLNGDAASVADFMASPGIGIQWLASLLDQALPAPLTMPFTGLDL